MKNSLNKFVVFSIIITMSLSTWQRAALAGMIGTEAALNSLTRVETIDKTQRYLAQDRVSTVLQDMGVEPDQILQRINSLTDAELVMLSGRIDNAPAGAGALEVLGIVFLVLLVLELVGVINIFNKV